MEKEIIIVTTEFLSDYIRGALKNIPESSNAGILTYSSYLDLQEIFSKLPYTTKAIITSGSFPSQVFLKAFPKSDMIIKSINNDDAGIYRLLLQLSDKIPNQNFDYVFADLLEMADIDINEFIFTQPEESVASSYDRNISAMSLEEMMGIEKKYIDRHVKLWQEKKICISITRFSSIMFELKERGIDAYFAYPSVLYVQEVFKDTLKDISIRELKISRPLCMFISISENKDLPKNLYDESLNLLENDIKRFFTLKQIGHILKKKANGIELITDQKFLKHDDRNFNQLETYLESNLNFSVIYGLGLGHNLLEARLNAIYANREATLLPKDNHVFINEEGEMTVFNTQKAQLVIPSIDSSYLEEVCGKTDLSQLTIQKLISINKSIKGKEISSEELAQRLSITKRSANRHLKALTESGYAEVAGKKTSTSRGRPELLYKLFLDDKQIIY